MSITLKTNQIKLKIQNGNYQAPVVIADQTTSEHVAEVNTAITTTGNQQVSAIQTKGDEVLDSIPEDYTDLVEEVDELKSAFDLELVSDYVEFEQGGITGGFYDNDNPAVYNIRVRSADVFRVILHMKISVATGYSLSVFWGTSPTNYVAQLTEASSYDIDGSIYPYVRFLVKKSGDATLTPLEAKSAISILCYPNDTVLEIYNKTKEIDNKLGNGGTISPDNYSAICTDVDNLTPNKVYYFYETITSNMVAHLPVYGTALMIYTLERDSNFASGKIQVAYGINGNCYQRYKGATWRDWVEYRTHPISPMQWDGMEVEVFHKGLFIGDSLTEGVINHNEGGVEIQTTVFPNYSMPTQFTKYTNVQSTNMGKAGKTIKQWYELYADTDLSGHDFAVIKLGVNDGNQQVAHSESETYLQNIITKVKTDNLQIKIFVCTIPADRMSWYPVYYAELNEIIKTIVANNLNCFLIDLSKYSQAKGSNYAAGHLNALGYSLEAKEIANNISYIIANNLSDFKNVQFAGTNYSDN